MSFMAATGRVQDTTSPSSQTASAPGDLSDSPIRESCSVAVADTVAEAAIPLMGDHQVRLINRKGDAVATGHVLGGVQGQSCHGATVNHKVERVVCVEEVMDALYPVPDAPQGDDYNVLGDLVGGQCFIIWPITRMILV